MLRITCLTVLLLLIGAADKRKTVTVSIKDMTFTPASIKITSGDSVRWTNNDDRDHSVNAADGSFKSGNIRSGGSYGFRFEKIGKFPYGCGYHPRMKGTVTVSD